MDNLSNVSGSIARQSVAELGGRRSILALQRRDHVELDRLLQRVGQTSGAEQERVLRRVYRLVFPHAFAEEAVLWPAARRALSDGDRVTLDIEQEHQQVNEMVTRLERSRPGEPGRAALLGRVVEVLRQDVRDEEDVLLPQLQQALDVSALRRLGLAWEVVRRTAPTRPHPVVSRRPPGNVVAALPFTVIDRARDRLESATDRAPAAVAQAARRVSEGLAALAGAVERLPVMRRGEDASTHLRA